MKRRIGLYPGTFDPITLGHVDVIQRAARLVDHLIIGVAENAGKAPLFTLPQRTRIVSREMKALTKLPATIEVRSFSNLLLHFAMECEADVIIRGLRAVSDFEYEFQMAGMNARLNPRIDTVFLMAGERYQFISSRLVKEIARLGGDIKPFVSLQVAGTLAETLGQPSKRDKKKTKKK